jgi:phosphoglycolate phosphatase
MDHVGHGAAAMLTGTLGPRQPVQAAADLEAFRVYYSAHLLDETQPYPGAVEAVAGLVGRRRAVLSNKPEAMTRTIVEALGFAPHLDGAWGGDSFPAMKPDPAPIVAVLGRLGVASGRALMVGDSDVDIEAAARAGVRSVRVRTGLWRSSRLVPDAEVEDLRELARRLDSAV